ncbi:MAG: diphosphate--fructose-6-phosphate 1-phosphotransferase [Phycisphaerales bacterium]|nr:diphosphate--fructose-6-phosphate 1-phosphotransferase [Phycisphaerales bacterium]
MTDLLSGNAVIGQSGGPTAVINQSLVGTVEGLRTAPRAGQFVKKILGMRHGVRGLTKSDFVDLTQTRQDKLERIAATPSAALGSTRDKPDAEYCQRILDACRKNDIRYFFYIGGNDSSDTCRIVQEIAAQSNYDMRCFHIPKTVDNDLRENDHCPGYPSAARFVAMAFMADALDNAALPGIKVNVVMGRHAGFLTAAAALARQSPRSTNIGVTADRTHPYERESPQLIYLPEVPFDIDRFIIDVESVYSKIGRCQIALSEGIKNKDGKEIGPTLMKHVQRDAHGNVQLSGSGALGDALADLIREKLTPAGGKPPRVRADTFGYIQRCWPDASPIDSREARAAGGHAAKLALSVGGQRSGSITIKRTGSGSKGQPYASDFGCVALAAVAAKTRTMPSEFIGPDANVASAFIDYAAPLVGQLPHFERL